MGVGVTCAPTVITPRAGVQGRSGGGSGSTSRARSGGTSSTPSPRSLDWRVLYRPLSDAETGNGDPGILVAPVVNRRNLLRAVGSLQT